MRGVALPDTRGSLELACLTIELVLLWKAMQTANTDMRNKLIVSDSNGITVKLCMTVELPTTGTHDWNSPVTPPCMPCDAPTDRVRHVRCQQAHL
jgi:hypothetical protein